MCMYKCFCKVRIFHTNMSHIEKKYEILLSCLMCFLLCPVSKVAHILFSHRNQLVKNKRCERFFIWYISHSFFTFSTTLQTFHHRICFFSSLSSLFGFSLSLVLQSLFKRQTLQQIYQAIF